MRTLTLSFVALLLLGCAKRPEPTPAPAVTSTKTRNAPAWVDNPGVVPNAMVGIGVENPNPLDDTMMQRRVALANARAELAKQIGVRVQGLFAALTQQYNTAAQEAGKKPLTQAVMSRMVDDTQRELVNVELSGATPREFWTDPETRKLWVLVTLDKDSLDRATKAAAGAALRKEIAHGEQGLQDALGRLDSALAAADK